MTEPGAALTGPVHVIGAGLLGTSVGLACRRAGVEVLLSDRSPAHVRAAAGLGAGAVYDGRPCRLVVVAVPPDHLGQVIAGALSDPGVVVTDVGSVKGAPLREVLRLAGATAASRYVGSHPMAGSERSGPLAATAGLFEGRPWAVTPHAGSDPAAVEAVEALVRAAGALPVRLSVDEHDAAVARTSHLPHLLSALVAGRLADAPAGELELSGQGVRDVTRIAAGDPLLWQQIVSANADAVVRLLGDLRADLDGLIEALATGDRAPLHRLLQHGVEGTAAIPAKHGGPPRPMRSVWVAVPDRPGGLARLFGVVGDLGVSIEDIHIDHEPGRPVGQFELVVAAERADFLYDALEAGGWDVQR